MQAGQLRIESHPKVGQISASFSERSFVESLLARVVTLINRLFGCWHTEMSRPFSSQGQTYRTCLSCGAQRQFNLKRWEMQGDFYYRLPTRDDGDYVKTRLRLITSQIGKRATAKRSAPPAQDGIHSILNRPTKLRKFAGWEGGQSAARPRSSITSCAG